MVSYSKESQKSDIRVKCQAGTLKNLATTCYKVAFNAVSGPDSRGCSTSRIFIIMPQLTLPKGGSVQSGPRIDSVGNNTPLKLTKAELDDYKYSKEQKCWRGPVNHKSAVSITKLSKLKQTKDKQLAQTEREKGLFKTLVRKINNAQRFVHPDSGHEEDAQSVSEEPLTEVPNIGNPFTQSQESTSSGNRASWCAPPVKKTDSSLEQFEWQKLGTKSDSSLFVSAHQQVVRLQQERDARDREIAILREQLLKAHEENYRIVQQLQGFTGSNYKNLEMENRQLREQLSLALAQNQKLEGLKRKEENTILNKQKMEKQITDIHGTPNKNILKLRTSNSVKPIAFNDNKEKSALKYKSKEWYLLSY